MQKKRVVDDGDMIFGPGTTLLLLMFVNSLLLYLWNPSYSSVFFAMTTNSSVGSISNVTAGTQGQVLNLQSTLDSILLASAGATVLGSFIFPNPYGLFAGIAFFLTGIFGVPVALFMTDNLLPVEIRVFLVAYWALIGILSTLFFIRGNTW